MIKQFEKLTKEEQELLYKAPVLVSVLASCTFKQVNKIQKADAIKLAHLKTFTAVPLLIPYYIEVDKKFTQLFDVAIKKYFPFDDAKRHAFIKEMDRVNLVIEKLDINYAQTLHKSFKKYATHVKRSIHSVFEDFIFPMPIPGLTD